MFEKFFSRLKLGKVILLLSLLGLIAYANTISHPFVHDDVVFIQNNPHIADLSNPLRLFVETSDQENIKAANPYYRPMLELLYRLEYRAFQLRPSLYHLFNIGVHIVNAILVYVLLHSLLKRTGLSFLIAVIFLVHPVQSQAVASIAGVSNLLYVLFCLISFNLYLENFQFVKNRFRTVGYPLSLFFFLMGLFAKEQAVVLPLLILLYEIMLRPVSQGERNKRIMHVGGFFVVALFYILFRKMISDHSIFESLWTYKAELWLRIQSIPKIILILLGIVFNFDSLHYYRSVDILDPTGPSIILFLVVFIGIGYFIYKLSEDKRPLLLFGIGWFFIALLPVINIFPMIIEYSLISVAEHFLYLPIIGVILCVCLFVEYLWPRKKQVNKIVIFMCLSIMVMGLVGRTMLQNRYWRGEIPLFERTIKYEKRIARVHILLARAYYFGGHINDAIDSYQTALKIMTEYVKKAKAEVARDFYLRYVKEIHFDLAHCYEAKKDYERAVAHYQKASAIDPNDGTIFNNLGTAYLLKGDVDEAAVYFSKAIDINPYDVMALNNLSICYINQNRISEAEELLERAMQIDKKFNSAKQNFNQLLRTDESQDQ